MTSDKRGWSMPTLSDLTQDWALATGVLAAFIAAFFMTTRFITTVQLLEKKEEEEKGSLPPRVPYWIPLLGSTPSFWYDAIGFLESTKEAFPQGLFSVKLWSRRKTYIYSSSLAQALEAENVEKLDSTEPTLRLLQSAFGLPYRYFDVFNNAWPGVKEQLAQIDSFFGPRLCADALKTLDRQMADLVSFANSPIDQHQWERTSGTVLLDDKETVETGLVALVQTYLTHFTAAQLLSPALLESVPDLAPLLLTLPSEVNGLLHKPSVGTPRGVSVVRTLLRHTLPFLDAVYASEEEQEKLTEFEDVPHTDSPFIKILQTNALRAAPEPVQASVLLYLLTLSVIPHTVVPWALVNLHGRFASARKKFGIYAREEADKLVFVTQEPGIGAFKPPPNVKVSEKVARAEALNGLVAEEMAMYAKGWKEWDVVDDFTVEAAGERWHFRAGETVVVASWLSDEEQEEVHEDAEQAVKLAMEQLGDFHLPALSQYLTTLYTGFIASFLKLYSLEPSDPEGWTIPLAGFAPGVALPKRDVRVRIRTRDYDQDGKEVAAKESRVDEEDSQVKPEI